VYRREGCFVNVRVGANGICKGKRKAGEEAPRPRSTRGRVRRAAKGCDEKQCWRIKPLLEHGRGVRRVWFLEGL
jgi:hypothetical protein